MSGRRRSSPALPLTSARLLDVLDRMYDLEASELDWLRGISEAIRPSLDYGGGVGALIYPVGGQTGARVGLGFDIDVMWSQCLRAVPLEIIIHEELITPISNAARCGSPWIRRFAEAGHTAMGVQSLTALNGTDLENQSMSIAVPAPIGGHEFWPERDRTFWERISAHLGAAFRMRNRVAAREAPTLIMDSGGGLQHVEPGLTGAELAPLREAVAAVDRARRIRMSPEAILGAWRALHEGRWSIVESMERDGRRLLVARPNVPLRDGDASPSTGADGRPPPHKLSTQERRVLIALGKGHSNKLIAYELGLATSTVSTLLARAARKLGAKNRIELARAGRALEHRLAGQTPAEQPA